MDKLAGILVALQSTSDFSRLDALDRLRSMVIREGNLGFGTATDALYDTLGPLLVDTSWTVSSQTVDLVDTIVNVCSSAQEKGLCALLPKLVANLGVDLLRQATLQVLSNYVTTLGAAQPVMSALMKSGLKNRDFRVRLESLLSIKVVFSTDAKSALVDAIDWPTTVDVGPVLTWVAWGGVGGRRVASSVLAQGHQW